jgi:FkbM family methyltransferase
MDASLLKKRIEQKLRAEGSQSGQASSRHGATGEVDLSGLLLIHDQEQFLREAYRVILKREADPSGFLNYLRLLNDHVPRVVVLRAIATSEEASRTGLKYRGIDLKPGTFPSSLRSRVVRFAQRFVEKVYSRLLFVYRAVFLQPAELIDRKLDYVIEDLIARNDRLSGKLDEAVGALRAELMETGRSISATLQEDRAQARREWHHLQAAVGLRAARLEGYLASLRATFSGHAAERKSDVELIAGRIARSEDLFKQELTTLRDEFSARLETVERVLDTFKSSVGERTAELDTLGRVVAHEVIRLGGLLKDEFSRFRADYGGFVDPVIRSQSELGQKLLAVDDGVAAVRDGLIALKTQVDALVEAQRSAASASGFDFGLKSDEFVHAQPDQRTPRPVIWVNDALAVTELDGHLIAMPSVEWRLLAFVAFRGFPEPGLVKAFRSILLPGMVVVDVGAHLGIYTLEAARRLQGHGKIYSFEPTYGTYSLLIENIQLNGYRESGIVVARQQAVLDRSGRAVLHVYPENSGHNTLFGSDECGVKEDVATVALDEALDGEAEVHVVKIDAEGAEPFILRGMKQIISRSPHINIFLEFAATHLRRAGVEPREFLEEIDAMGFEIKVVDDLSGEALDSSWDDLARRHTSNIWLRLK